MSLRIKTMLGSLLGIALLLASCTQKQEMEQEETAVSTQYTKAVAVIHPLQGDSLRGTVTFEQQGDNVHVVAHLEGLKEGNHGFHIHQYGDCSAPDGSSAGGHYSPNGHQHGSPTADDRHMGDMGNIPAMANGSADLDYTDSKIKLNGPNSIIGHAVIVHQGEDDMSSQPSGAAGPRIGCGVIGIANTEANSQ